jgi:ribosomal protein L37AE/L43A
MNRESKCEHDIDEQETAVAEYLCPLCLQTALKAERQENKQLRDSLDIAYQKGRIDGGKAAETKVAELEASALTGYEDGWHKLRSERDELKAKAFRVAVAYDALNTKNARLHDALKNLLSYAERNECHHENTHRGGIIWTICDDCGMKWADDEGGFKPYCEPVEIAAARQALGEKE